MLCPIMPHTLAIRCDGGAAIGAGHVARCLPLARAFADRGWEVRFCGTFDGLAQRKVADFPQGPLEGADAVIVDSYEPQPLPDLPLATIGESLRYPGAVWIDYHLDRADDEPTAELLPGPRFAPVDPGFARAGRASDPIETILVTVGSSEAARTVIPQLVEQAERIGRVIVADGSTPLIDLVPQVDAAISGAGMTAYELASAGLPLAIVQLADNQRRVVDGLLRARIAVEGAHELEPGPNERGMALFDGRGAARAAAALEERWSLA
jgi:spore coat polysaccharide biosynthesis predicted glycosyltransferase SpsG